MFAGLNFWPSGAFGSDCAATSASARFAIGRAKPAFDANSMNFRRDTAPEKRSSNRLLIVPSSVTRSPWFAQVVTVQHGLRAFLLNTETQRHKGTKKAGKQRSSDAGFLSAFVSLC